MTHGFTYELDVDGIVLAREIWVEEDSWCDFVFDEDYDLMPLDDLQEYVRHEKHLPGIPKADEVVENGVMLSSYVRTSLQKIEELTLYVIALHNENAELNKRLHELESQR